MASFFHSWYYDFICLSLDESQQRLIKFISIFKDLTVGVCVAGVMRLLTRMERLQTDPGAAR